MDQNCGIGFGKQPFQIYQKNFAMVLPGKDFTSWSLQAGFKQEKLMRKHKEMKDKVKEYKKFGEAHWPKVVAFTPMRDNFFCIGGFLHGQTGLLVNRASK